ncbi:MAG: DUF4258 domain-containing protein [Candidatus Kapaibacteriota bacterium]
MKYFDWNKDKNEVLKANRKISFEDIIYAIEHNKVVNIIKHPNSAKFPNQSIFYIHLDNYIYAVPFVEDEEKIFLKTIYKDRIAKKKYLGG